MINKDTPIIEVIRTNSNARDVFIKHGMGCIGCMGSAIETIEIGAKMHDLSVDDLVKELNKVLGEK